MTVYGCSAAVCLVLVWPMATEKREQRRYYSPHGSRKHFTFTFITYLFKYIACIIVRKAVDSKLISTFIKRSIKEQSLGAEREGAVWQSCLNFHRNVGFD